MHVQFRSCFLLLFSLLVGGCEIINPEEEIPAYVQIRRPVFNDPLISYPAAQIIDGWLTIDNSDLIGGFELPATVPVLNSGNQKIVSVAAGVYSDGQHGVRIDYPFYEVYKTTVNLQPASTTVIEPVFRYQDRVEFPVNETFDLPGSSQLSLKSPYDTGPKTATFGPGESFPESGSTYGLIKATTNTIQPIWWVSTSSILTLPKGGASVFMEINYKSSLALEIGVLGDNGYYASQLSAYPTDTWTKLYIDLTEEVSKAPAGVTNFQLSIKSSATGNTGTDYVALDNVRIVHFQ